MNEFLKRFLVMSLVGAAIVPGVCAADDCKYQQELNYELDIKSANSLQLKAGAGSLKVEGREGLENIQVEAQLCASDAEALEELDVLAQVTGDKVKMKTVIGEPKLGFFAGNKSSYINLALLVPNNFDVDAEDSSGAAVFSTLRSLKVEDSSGELVIKGIGGDVDVEDSSGKIEILQVEGSVTVVDSSGEIEATSIGQDLIINADSSGDINGRDINGNYIVKVDSSGSIFADNVGGEFRVDRDSSGGIKYDNVAGKVSLPH